MGADSSSFYRLYERALELERQGRPLVKLNVGVTSLPPPTEAVAAATAAMGAPSGYGPAAGLPGLRAAIARREGCDDECVVVGPGSKFLLFALLSVLRESGRRLVTPSPYWPAYPLIAQQVGLGFRSMQSSLETRWDLPELPLERGDAVMLCNPLNPTSTVYPRASVERLIARAKDSGAHVIIDEAYRGISFVEIPSYDAIRVRSFSKEFNMEGWRLGYVVAPHALARALTQFVQISTTCVAPFVQEAGRVCLASEAEVLARHRETWRSRLEALAGAMDGAGFRFVRPDAGMYLFATHPAVEDTVAFAERLIDRGVAVAPGDSFGPYDRYVRVSASADEATLVNAARTMQEAIHG